MDVQEEIQGLWFEWDEEKNNKNIEKHHISFRTAAYVFMDDNRLELYDDFHSDDEDRYKVIGLVNKVLCVICTERKDATRIISARLATAKERSAYYGDYKDLY